MSDPAANPSISNDAVPPLPAGLLSQYPWLTFVLPILVYMIVGSFEPAPPERDLDGNLNPPTGGAATLGLDYSHYPVVYVIKIALTLGTMVFVYPGYRAFPFRVSPVAIVVGWIGAVAWIVLCKLQLEARLLEPLLPEWFSTIGERPAFNPLAELGDRPLLAYSFLGIRFLGLALVVPVIEEFFLRGFAMRFMVDPEWWKVPFGTVNRTAIIIGTAIPMLMHPGELLAAFVWFSAVTWLMLRTRNIWDCVAAHAITNLLLGIYVVTSGDWWLM